MSDPKEIEFHDPNVILLPLKSQELWIEYAQARLAYLTHKKKVSSYDFRPATLKEKTDAKLTLDNLAEQAESKEAAWLKHVTRQLSG